MDTDPRNGMSDLFDLEAQMVAEEDQDDRTQRAQERVARGLPRPVSRETHADMARTAWLQKHNPRAVHTWLLDLENQCIDLLQPEDAERLRRTQ